MTKKRDISRQKKNIILITKATTQNNPLLQHPIPMKKLLLFLIPLFILSACNSKAEQENIKQNKPTSTTEKSKAITPTAILTKDIADFIPKGFIQYKEEGINEVKGDLNKDGLEDIIILIKGVNKDNIVQDENRGALDRNRRGIIVLFNKGDHYEVASKNYDCFSSENEDGGVYYAPELYIEIKNYNLCVNYAHGRYGYWQYTFRYQNGDFELIGYDLSENHGPITQYETSVNFLTKKKLTRENLNKDEGDEVDEKFKDTWEKINLKNLLRLSTIKDFDELDF